MRLLFEGLLNCFYLLIFYSLKVLFWKGREETDVIEEMAEEDMSSISNYSEEVVTTVSCLPTLAQQTQWHDHDYGLFYDTPVSSEVQLRCLL